MATEGMIKELFFLRKRKKHHNHTFIPFKFVISLFAQEKTGNTREVSSTATSKNQRHVDLVLPADIPPIGEIQVHIQWTIACPGGERCKRL